MFEAFIYKITNIVNGKVYIGQSVRPVDRRFQRHINDATNNILDTHFARAIRKYGSDSFVIEVIDSADTQDELNIKEREWIHRYQSTNPSYGYNETDAIYKSGGNTYQSKSDEEMTAIGQKLSATKAGSLNPNSAAVKCLNIFSGEEIVFSTVKECQEHFQEKTHRFVTTRVTGQTRGLYKGEWAIAYCDCDYKYETVVHKTGMRLYVTDLETGTTEMFASVRLFCRSYGIDRAVITKHTAAGEKEFSINNKYKIIVQD